MANYETATPDTTPSSSGDRATPQTTPDVTTEPSGDPATPVATPSGSDERRSRGRRHPRDEDEGFAEPDTANGYIRH